MLLRFCTKCNTMPYWDREGHYCCECIAVLPIPDEDGDHYPEFMPDHWIDAETDTVGAEAIAAERQRQVEVEGWTWEHDDQHANEQLASAAAFYAIPEKYGELTAFWRFDPEWNKKRKHNRVRQLVIAGALIAAEIDRLIRLEIKGS